MINDFWFLKFDFAPHDPAVERRCMPYYRRPIGIHWTLYLLVALIWWPLTIPMAIAEFIRFNTAAYYNAKIYRAEYYNNPEDLPPMQAENRLVLYVLAGVIVWAIMFVADLIREVVAML